MGRHDSQNPFYRVKIHFQDLCHYLYLFYIFVLLIDCVFDCKILTVYEPDNDDGDNDDYIDGDDVDDDDNDNDDL
jgi:hypothetical protein